MARIIKSKKQRARRRKAAAKFYGQLCHTELAHKPPKSQTKQAQRAHKKQRRAMRIQAAIRAAELKAMAEGKS